MFANISERGLKVGNDLIVGDLTVTPVLLDKTDVEQELIVNELLDLVKEEGPVDVGVVQDLPLGLDPPEEAFHLGEELKEVIAEVNQLNLAKLGLECRHVNLRG